MVQIWLSTFRSRAWYLEKKTVVVVWKIIFVLLWFEIIFFLFEKYTLKLWNLSDKASLTQFDPEGTCYQIAQSRPFIYTNLPFTPFPSFSQQFDVFAVHFSHSFCSYLNLVGCFFFVGESSWCKTSASGKSSVLTEGNKERAQNRKSNRFFSYSQELQLPAIAVRLQRYLCSLVLPPRTS